MRPLPEKLGFSCAIQCAAVGSVLFRFLLLPEQATTESERAQQGLRAGRANRAWYGRTGAASWCN